MFTHSFKTVSNFLNIPVRTLSQRVYPNAPSLARLVNHRPEVFAMRLDTVVDLITHYGNSQAAMGLNGRAVQVLNLMRQGNLRFTSDSFRVLGGNDAT